MLKKGFLIVGNFPHTLIHLLFHTKKYLLYKKKRQT